MRLAAGFNTASIFLQKVFLSKEYYLKLFSKIVDSLMNEPTNCPKVRTENVMLILLTFEGMFKIVLTDEEMSCVDLNAINYESSCASAYS